MLYVLIVLNIVAYFTNNQTIVDVSIYTTWFVCILSTLFQFTALVAIGAGYVDLADCKPRRLHANHYYAYSRIIAVLVSYVLIDVGYLGVWLACLCFIEYVVHLSYFNYMQGK